MADQYLDVIAAQQPLAVSPVNKEKDRVLGEPDEQDSQPEGMKPKGRFFDSLKGWRPPKLVYAAACFVIVVAALWLAAGMYIANFQLGSKRIATRDSDSVIRQDILSTLQGYRLTIAYPDNTRQSFALNSAGIQVNTTATLKAMRHEQTALSTRLQWWRPIPVQLVLQTDTVALNSFIASHAAVTVAPAKDASLTITGGTVQLAAATAGKQYGLPNAAQAIQTMAAGLSASPLVLKTIALSPTLTAAELAGPEATVKQVLAEHISFSVGGQTTSPSPSDIASWLTLTPNEAKKTVDITVNSGNVTAYIDNLADNATRPSRDQVNMSVSGGGMTVAVQGQDGVSVSGQQTAATTVSQSLLAGKGLQVTLSTADIPYGSITAGDWSKWIEVDLTTKRMYAFQSSSVVNTFLVSAGKPSTPTPTGQFAIWDKLTSQTMVGPGYVQPDVPWINYFDHSGDAIHGNYWRAASVFGNENTSHGCVGLQVAPAEWVYDWAPIGTPVIIHD